MYAVANGADDSCALDAESGPGIAIFKRFVGEEAEIHMTSRKLRPVALISISTSSSPELDAHVSSNQGKLYPKQLVN